MCRKGKKKRGKKNIYNRKKKKKKIREKKGYWEDVRHTTEALNGGTSLPSPSPCLFTMTEAWETPDRFEAYGLDYTQNARFLSSEGTSLDSFVILLIPMSLEDGAKKVCQPASLPISLPLAAPNWSPVILCGSFGRRSRGFAFTFNGKILPHSVDKTSAEMDLSLKVPGSLKRKCGCLIEIHETCSRSLFDNLLSY